MQWIEQRIEDGVTLRGGLRMPVLTEEAVAFVAALHRRFDVPRRELLEARATRLDRIRNGERLDFLPETRTIRESDWRVAEIPAPLLKRTVEITGPVDRKMIINALNSGADCFMADFEDSLSPTWDNLVQGQRHLIDAVRRAINYQDSNGRRYLLGETLATLIVRPRGLHLVEPHLMVDDAPTSGALFDFGLFVFHNAVEQVRRGVGPYFYLPKLESHREAAWWREVFVFAEQTLGLVRGTIKATVLIETIQAAFEMDEILWELRDYCVGLNCGRWDYLFSAIRTFAHDPAWLMPDRAQVTMTTHMMRAYSLLLIHTCHRRGAFAMGGMAAQIPIKDDSVANERALTLVRLDKEREAVDGHDGTWVAHPALVELAREAFGRICQDKPNQVSLRRDDVRTTAADLLTVPLGTLTEVGVRGNIQVCLRYLAAWLDGNGCVPIFHLMEDAATAEIARVQLWQWLAHGAVLRDGRVVSRPLLEDWIADARSLRPEGVREDAWKDAGRLLRGLTFEPKLAPFLTEVAYPKLF